MLTWSLCWLINKMGGAGEGIGILLVIAMGCDVAIAYYIFN